MRSIVIPGATGILGSLLASYIYAGLTSTQINPIYIVTSAILFALAAWLIRWSAPRLRVISSGIVAYYPGGQARYIRELLAHAQHAKHLTVVGARGLDLIGERSPLGSSLPKWQWHGSLDVFLLDPDSAHARLRTNHLEVERRKYRDECYAVDDYLAILFHRYGVEVYTYHFDTEPLFRGVIADDVAFVALYEDGVQGRRLPAYQLSHQRLLATLQLHCNHLKAIAKKRSYGPRHESDQ